MFVMTMKLEEDCRGVQVVYVCYTNRQIGRQSSPSKKTGVVDHMLSQRIVTVRDITFRKHRCFPRD
jgi:hypothetical protein